MPPADNGSYRFGLRVEEQGRVAAVGDGIAWIEGLPSAALEQLVIFGEGGTSYGMLFNLAEEQIGAIVLDGNDAIAAGTRVRLAETTLSVPVGDGLLGRVVDPLCRPLDGNPIPRYDGTRPLDIRAPSIAERDFVHDALYTGNTIVDTMLPIGRGQRQLFIGDRGLGKTSLALDAVVNQRSEDVLFVYALVGQRRSDVLEVIETLEATGAMAHGVVVVAEASSAPGLQYVAPYAACAIAEHWMRLGKHVLVVYDDLTRHAQAYRTLSLLLRRPPGREAYPGDIFFLHSRLLERASVLSPALGGGSLTAIPIVETEEGEIASYIPTNLISITDGQTYFDRELFASGILPAIDVTRSVSRVGGSAQHPAVRDEAGRMRLEYLQALELERFSRLGTRLDAATTAKIARGRVLRAILKQERLSPHSIAYELAWMVAFNDGLFDASSPADVPALLKTISDRVAATTLALGSTRGEWSDALHRWLAPPGAAQP